MISFGLVIVIIRNFNYQTIGGIPYGPKDDQCTALRDKRCKMHPLCANPGFLFQCLGNYTSALHLKEYYEIVDEARPLSGIFPTHADFLMEMLF